MTFSFFLRIFYYKLKGVKMLRSECCGAIVYDDYDLCSECLDHCDVWEDVDEDEDEPYDHSIDTIDPDEPPIPGPPYDSYGYNDGDK